MTGGKILEKMGVGAVFMALGEVFESMLRGTIDAFECTRRTLTGTSDSMRSATTSGCPALVSPTSTTRSSHHADC